MNTDDRRKELCIEWGLPSDSSLDTLVRHIVGNVTVAQNADGYATGMLAERKKRVEIHGWSWCPFIKYFVKNHYGHYGAAAVLCKGESHVKVFYEEGR